MTSEEKIGSSKVPQFREHDPIGWYDQFEGFMMRSAADTALIEERPEEEGSKQSTWDKRNKICISYLQEAVCESQNTSARLIVFDRNVNRHKSAKQICDILIETFRIKDARVIHSELENFAGLKLETNERPISFINRIEEAREKLRQLGRTLNEEVDLVGRLIAGLEIHADYRALAVGIKLQANISWTEAKNMVRAEDLANPKHQKTTSEQEKAHFTSTNKNETITCQICRKPGHSAAKCFHRFKGDPNKNDRKQSDEKGSYEKGKQIKCYYCGKIGHKAPDCRKKKKDMENKKKDNSPGGNQHSGNKKRSGWDDINESASMMQESGSKRART